MNRCSIKFRLISAVIIPVFLVVLLFALFTLHQNRSFFNSSLIRDAQSIILPFHSQLLRSLPSTGNNRSRFISLSVKTMGAIGFPDLIQAHSNLLSICFIDSKGKEVFAFGDVILESEEFKQAINQSSMIVGDSTFSNINKNHSAVVIPLLYNGSVDGYSVLIFSVEQYNAQYQRLLQTIMIVLFMASVVGVGGAYWVGQRITRPIISLADHIRNPDIHALDVDTGNHDEVGVLTQRFKEMQLEIEKKIRELNHEIKTRTQAEARVRNIAFYDMLTGLPNRHLFNDRLNVAIAKTMRKPSTLAVIFVDFDGFKNINDLHGHPAGDDLLRIIGERLASRFRTSDTIARFGGDEFVAIVEAENDSELETLTDDIVTICSKPAQVDHHTFCLSASVGVCLYPPQGATATELLKNADIAMYRAKAKGGNCSVIFNDAMAATISEKVQFKNDLVTAVKEQQFELHYQPIINLETNRVGSVEALIRWRHPSKGLLYPDTFIGVAEKNDLIGDIGHWVFKEACRQFQCWKSTIDNNMLETICINVSPKQIEEASFVDRISAIIRETGIQAENIEIEITENALMLSSQDCHNRLQEIRLMGVKIAIDDFGTGYSSFSYLWQFPINTLKIDRSFVDSCAQDQRKVGILQAIIGITNTLSIDVIAEGIETEEDCLIVRNSHCNRGQGYLFSKPIEADLLVAYIKDH